MSPERVFTLAGALSALTAVAAGAFGAHALRGRLTPELLAVFETGARYQMYHALALLFVAWAYTRWASAWMAGAGWLFVLGTLLFAGSLYALSLTGVRGWGAVTPVGGLALILGWGCLAWGALAAR